MTTTENGRKPATLKYTELFPEAPTFELSDGQMIHFRPRTDFSPKEGLQHARLLAELERMQESFGDAEGDPTQDEEDQVIDRLEEMVGQFVTMILPDISDAELAKLAWGHRLHIMRWWQAQNLDPVQLAAEAAALESDGDPDGDPDPNAGRRQEDRRQIQQMQRGGRRRR